MSTPFSDFVAWLKPQVTYPTYILYRDGDGNQIVIGEYSGNTHDTIPLDQLSIQIKVYNTKQKQCEEIAWSLFKVLHQHDRFDLASCTVEGIFANQTPYELPKEELGNNNSLYCRVFNLKVFIVS